ncbi:MAG TPA: MMPL family transporter [Gillisia sp.]|nr:MMPL family transporter [Gillisia sp.]
MLKIHNFLNKHKKSGLLIGLLFLAGVIFFASRITLEEDVTSLIPSGERQDVLKKVLAQTEFSDKIIVAISTTSEESNPDELTQYAQKFIDSVNTQIPEFVKNIQGKVPEEGIREIYDFVYNNLPLFLNETDYKAIETRLGKDSIQNRLKENYKSLISPAGLVTKEYLFKDPLSITYMGLKKLEELQVGDDFELYNNFLITKDQKHLLLFISPSLPASETDKNSLFVNKLQEIQANLDREFKGVKGEFFGGLLYSVANANQIKKDIKITIGIAMGILLILLVFYYRKIYVPLLIFVPSIIGGITAIAFLYLLKGSISAISIGIGAILLGISIDYALHILTHYRNNSDLSQLYKDVTTPVLMSSATTAIAFLCLLFVHSEALNDLGIFAAVSVMLSSILSLILIPLFYTAPKFAATNKPTFIDKISAIDFHKKKPLVIFMVLLFLGGLFFFTKVEFNNDLSAINYQPAEIQQVEENIENIAGRAAKSIYLVSYGNSTDQALDYNNSLYNELSKLKNKGEITNFSSIGGVVLSTSTQLGKFEQWQNFWTPEKKEQIQANLIEESAELGFKPESFENFYQLLSKDFKPIDLEDYRTTTNLYLDDFISSGSNFSTVTTSVDIKEKDISAVLKKFQGDEHLVVVDRKQINQSFLGNLKNDFNKLIAYSIIAVFLVLLFSYRSLELTILTLFPILITWVIALGIMAVLNIEFNILNIIISTFIFGLGLDYSIFITNAFLKEYEFGSEVLKTYRTSILLSVITTLLGIGALFFAKHPALQSISLVSIIGVISAVFTAFILQGFLFESLFLKRVNKGLPAFNFKRSLTPSKNAIKKDKLYFKAEVYDNYRYKSIFSEVKKEFETDRERYLKLAGFIEQKENVLHFYSGWGILPIYLSYKKPGNKIVGFEPEFTRNQIADNCFAAKSGNLTFTDDISELTEDFQVFIISEAPLNNLEKELNAMLAKHAKKVIILDAAYSYRWILDLNFEIIYRQNEVVVLQKME